MVELFDRIVDNEYVRLGRVNSNICERQDHVVDGVQEGSESAARFGSQIRGFVEFLDNGMHQVTLVLKAFGKTVPG